MNAVILAGGKCRRLNNRPKAFLNIDGEPIIERMLRVLKGIFDEIIVVTNTTEIYEPFNIRIVKDLVKDKGPLGGIYSGLVNSSSNYNFIFACDMPFINPELVKYMIKNTGDYDVIIPQLDGCFEPLHAIYSKNCVKPIERQLKEGNFKIIDFFGEVKIRTMDRDEIDIFFPQRTFININTFQDYQRISKTELPSIRQYAKTKIQ